MTRGVLERRLIYLVTIISYLLVGTASCLAQGQVDSSSRIWIGEKDGLRLTAEIYRQEYKADDDMKVSVRFENLTDRNMYLSKHQNGRSDFSFVSAGFGYLNGHASVGFKEDKARGKYTKPSLSLDDFVLIAPKGIYAFDITIHLSDYQFFPGDVVSLAVYYTSVWRQTDVPELSGLWGLEHGLLYAQALLNGMPVPEPTKITIKN